MDPSSAPTEALLAAGVGRVTGVPAIGEGAGQQIGPYKLLLVIGEGGFGSVYLAEQTEPVARKVALKIIKLGMDTHEVVARFEQERQALAILDHPNIAKVFDAGATQTGRPFFVMELCTGEPIDSYCDRHTLSIPDRLKLFAQVCAAVQHAHTKGLIHRDIKPSNVLVSSQDGGPLAKVIDFGIAKATASRLSERTLFTEQGQLIGTPEYMSPEQAEGSLDIDTRTDVYSLGVLLYVLLTGTTPFTARELRSGAYGEIQRIIRQVDPPKPSTRLSHSDDTILGIAARRHTDPRRLGATVRGELDWIVMKAMEKDRNRRYESASGLARDVERYLSDDPVEACPPSTGYRLRKFVHKNRRLVAGAAVLLVVLLGATAVSTVFGVLASIAEAKAVRAAKEADDQRTIATKAAEDSLAAKAEADRQRDQALVQSYVANLAAASTSIDANEIVAARRRLDAAPAPLRGWEWSYLRAQSDQSAAVLTGDYPVQSLALSQDGTRIALAGMDNSVRLREFPSGRELAVMRGHQAPASSVAFHPDGNRIVSASYDKTVRLWDGASGRELAAFSGHEREVPAVAISPDGSRIASASVDKTVRIWDTETFQEVGVLRGHESHVLAVVFGPGGTRIASASDDKTVRLWDASTGRELAVLRGHEAGINDVDFSPDGSRLASGSADTTARVWDCSTGSELAVLRGHTGQVKSVAFSPDGSRLATSSGDSSVRLWEASSGLQLAAMRGHEDWIGAVAFTPDSDHVITGSADKTVRLWPASGGQELTVLRHPHVVSWIDFSGDGSRLASTCADMTVKIWDMTTGAQLAAVATGDHPHCVAFSPDAARVAVAGHDHLVRILDSSGGGEPLVLRGHESHVFSVDFSPDGTRLVSASDDKTLRIWNVSSAEEIGVLRGHEGKVVHVAFSHDGSRIASAGDDKTVRLWDGESGAPLATFSGHEDTVLAVAFSANGSRLATGSVDDSIRVWELPSGRPMAVLEGHQGDVYGLAFSPDGERIVSGSSDQTIRVWDASRGIEVLVLRGHSGIVFSVAFSPDGTRIASGSTDATVRLWDRVPYRERPKGRETAGAPSR